MKIAPEAAPSNNDDELRIKEYANTQALAQKYQVVLPKIDNLSLDQIVDIYFEIKNKATQSGFNQNKLDEIILKIAPEAVSASEAAPSMSAEQWQQLRAEFSSCSYLNHGVTEQLEQKSVFTPNDPQWLEHFDTIRNVLLKEGFKDVGIVPDICDALNTKEMECISIYLTERQAQNLGIELALFKELLKPQGLERVLNNSIEDINNTVKAKGAHSFADADKPMQDNWSILKNGVAALNKAVHSLFELSSLVPALEKAMAVVASSCSLNGNIFKQRAQDVKAECSSTTSPQHNKEEQVEEESVSYKTSL